MIGMVACNTGTRPSSLFNWDEPEEWIERLSFDISAVSQYKNKVKMEFK